MSEKVSPPAPLSARVSFLVRRLRLASGVVLFAFVASHLANHAAGLISLAAIEAALGWFQKIWLNPYSSTLIYSAFAVHFLLALWAVYRRRSLLHMRAGEAIQLLVGLAIVPALALHFVGTHVAYNYFGVRVSYTYVLLYLWHLAPDKGLLQVVALLVAWVHGTMGLYFWLRLKPWFRRAQPLLYAVALLLPVLALLGFAGAGREVARLAADPAWLADFLASLRLPTGERREALLRIEDIILYLFFGLLAAALAARALRLALEARRGRVRITYPGGRTVEISPGTSVLEASQQNGIAHTSVCGGRGRCSTCRVRVSQGLERLAPPSPGEQAVLARVGAPPNVRLACQLRPTLDLAVAPVVPPGAGAAAGWRRPAHIQGQEKEIAILFADLRGFTKLSERKLPYDVVFVLNRYFAAMGKAIEGAGGHVDKFIGDGVMALFGVESGSAIGSRQALQAAHDMALALVELNATLTHDLDQPLRVGIGLHTGPAIVGEMGHGKAVTLTAIGDAVNTASRIEALTKEFGAELVLSESVATAAGYDLSRYPEREVEIRGRAEKLRVRVIERAAELTP